MIEGLIFSWGESLRDFTDTGGNLVLELSDGQAGLLGVFFTFLIYFTNILLYAIFNKMFWIIRFLRIVDKTFLDSAVFS